MPSVPPPTLIFPPFTSSFPPLSPTSNTLEQVVDCRILSSLLACLYDALQHPVPIHTSDHFSLTARGGKGGGGGEM